jgi:hypothetical protein
LRRLAESPDRRSPWRRWGPYLSERQWGTVREDYSADGSAWDYFTHEQSHARAYRWGEDGLAGVSDRKQILCFALAFWNGKDPVLKERLFGLTNSQGNHGEDVKEYYYYLDSTPTHSYMKWLYRYPQGEYPYARLIEESRRRSRKDHEFELIDTGIFDGDRYFDVFAEYAKAAPEDLLVRVSVVNRGPERATLHVLPTLWFRNTWHGVPDAVRPRLARAAPAGGASVVEASHATLGVRRLHCEGGPPLLFTENETNEQRVFGRPNPQPYVKDAFHEAVVRGRADAINPAQEGTKAAAHYVLDVGPGETATIRLRLCDGEFAAPFRGFDRTLETRRREADEFYAAALPRSYGADRALVMRQALAGMLWGKQFYSFDVGAWLAERGFDPHERHLRPQRNREWFHMVNEHVISMPDKWEYPWYAAWDLAFHAIALAEVDLAFAKEQLELMVRETYLHPNGQMPAYEWNFSDVNPPVHAWAAMYLFRTEEALTGEGDAAFLAGIFGKLLTNFTWWVNQKDRDGRNVFEGGFLGLDNIGVFDRSAPLPHGGYLEQADGTAWMAMYAQNMGEIALELAARDASYEGLAIKFAEHFLLIAAALNRLGDGMWDEEDGFYYDVLRLPDGSAQRLKVRSMVGLLPLCAASVVEPWQRERAPAVLEAFVTRVRRTPRLLDSVHPVGEDHRGHAGRGMFALVTRERLVRILSRVLDEGEFLGPYGIRSLSKWHEKNPYVLRMEGSEYRVPYLPAESDTGAFGGNSNWRGPVWFPVNVLLIRALLQFYAYYGDTLRVECPTGSGRTMNLFEVSKEIADRLQRTFLRGSDGRRPVFGGAPKFQDDPNWKDHLLFYEYFHGDNGAGLGASHQTGWTGLVATIARAFETADAKSVLEHGKRFRARRAAAAR